ncbi:KH domain-containing protein [Candidatus Daviesbacteria bacterium]|nr:KH domain-containing protein [Candidatus Daviesbacteria bacterium]
MKDLIDYIVKSIVTKPEAVSIEEIKDESGIILRLTVDPTDMGIVIGKSGQTIQALRKILTVRAMAENSKVNLQLIETEQPQKTEE